MQIPIPAHKSPQHPYTSRAAFGLSTTDQNTCIATLEDKVAYIAGRFIVLYDEPRGASPRSRLSAPDECVASLTSLSVAPNHSSIAAIERLCDGGQRISFWAPDMAPRLPMIDTTCLKVPGPGRCHVLVKDSGIATVAMAECSSTMHKSYELTLAPLFPSLHVLRFQLRHRQGAASHILAVPGA
jgi:hypothetical protein